MGSLSEYLWCSHCDLSLGDTAAQVRSVSESHRCREAGDWRLGGGDPQPWSRDTRNESQASHPGKPGQLQLRELQGALVTPASGLAREKLVIRGVSRSDPVLSKAFLSALGSKGIEPDLQST